MKRLTQGKAKSIEIIAFTIIESIFVLIAVAVISLVLAGLLLKNAQLPAPGASESRPVEESSQTAP